MLLNSFLIIVPCHNEEENIDLFLNELTKSNNKISINYDICFVDDGSTDGTWAKIKANKTKYKNIKGVRLSRNFGKESAISAGLSLDDKIYDFFIIIDCDLQHPVKEIPNLIQTYRSGNYDIINTHRNFGSQGNFRELISSIFYKFMNRFSKINIISKTTDFMLISNKVKNTYNKINEIDKTFRILISWIGYKKISIPIEVIKRQQGKSKYNFINLLRLAVNTFSSYSILPLKFVGYLGIFMTIISFFLLTFVLLNFVYKFTIISWQTILIISQLFLSGIIMSSLGIIGLYISKILKNVNQRPNFIIDKII